MKLCFAIGSLSYSGAEKIMYHLLKELKSRGHEVSVILIACEEAYDNIDLEGIKQFAIFDREEEANRNRFARIYKRQQRIRKVLLENEFDLVVSFGVRYNLDVIQACRGIKVKTVLCERNDPYNDPASKLLRIRRKISYKKANAFVFQTEDIKNFFEDSIRKRAAVIPNFIEKRVLKEELCSEKRNSFVTCARLDDNQKNQTALIKAFYEFSKTNESYKLEFYGDGPDRKKYEQLIAELNMQDKIILHGRINNPMSEVKKCKFFVFSSKYEGMPNALIEAMAYGMPCIATDCSGGGVRALIENGVNGIIVPYGDQDALLSEMIRLSKDESLGARLGENAYEINDKLEMQNIISMWENFFWQVIE